MTRVISRKDELVSVLEDVIEIVKGETRLTVQEQGGTLLLAREMFRSGSVVVDLLARERIK